MIESIRLKNFQTHSDLLVDLNHPVTSIVGSTDAGKSAVIRALHWVCLNKPGGTSFIKWGAKGAGAMLTIDGRQVLRSRGLTTKNKYNLDGTDLSSFGAGVPDVVASVLGVTTNNFQGQHDAPYWFSCTPGEVSKKLNSIVNLEIIDHTVGELAGKVRANQQRVTDAENRLRGLRVSLAPLKEVPEIESRLSEIEDICNQQEQMDWQVQQLKILLHRIEITQKSMIPLAPMKAQWAEVQKSQGRAEQASEKTDKLEQLLSVIQAQSTFYDGADGIAPAFEPILKMRDVGRELFTTNKQLSDLLDLVVGLEEKQQAAQQKLSGLQQQLDEISTELPTCDACGQPLPQE